MSEIAGASPPSPATTPEAVEELRRLHEAATPGPWAWASFGEKCYAFQIGAEWFAPDDEDCERPLVGNVSGVAGALCNIDIAELHQQGGDTDAALIVAMRNNISGLLDAVAERDRLREELARAQAFAKGFQITACGGNPTMEAIEELGAYAGWLKAKSELSVKLKDSDLEASRLSGLLSSARAALQSINEYARTSYAEAAMRERVGDNRLMEVVNMARKALASLSGEQP